MVFSSTLFIFCFLPIVLSLYLIAHKVSCNLANIMLLFASIIFYAWGGIRYCIVLLLLVVLNYILVLAMVRYQARKSFIFALILCIDVGNLLYFKYFNFFVDNIRGITHIWGIEAFPNVAAVILPIGISFYTFQIISYVVDVYKGKIEVQRNPLKLALYVMMFPQLIAGPIVRYKDVNEEISKRVINNNDIEEGIKRFIIGFFKKVFIANSMGNMADPIFSSVSVGDISTVCAWLGAICYTLQIYYDFSAYSDMAIGIGRILGFHFLENFNLPYKSQSIQEFWRRWHISLSSWFRDYVYIPLGGNRKGTVRTYFNLAVVFFLTGLWHGAAWQFIVWGAYHGLFLILERLGLQKILGKFPRPIRHIYTLLVVIVGWVFFRADNLNLALRYIKNMFVINSSGLGAIAMMEQFTGLFVVCLFIAIIFSVTKLEFLKNNKLWANTTFERLRYIMLWLVSVLYLTGLSYNPFIYFKF